MPPLALPDVESSAAKLLAAGEALQIPVELERVYRLWPGLRVAEEPIENSGYLVDLGVHGYELVLRSTDNPGRKRFTCAHELGHLVLSQHGFEWQRCSAGERSASVERWCDRFAAALLMPSVSILDYLRAGRIRGLATTVLRGPAFFAVSRHAFKLRLTEVAALSILEYEVSENSGERMQLVTTARLPPALTNAAVAELKVLLRQEPERQIVPHEAQGLLSVARLIKRARGEVRWLVVICRLPQAMRKATLRDAFR